MRVVLIFLLCILPLSISSTSSMPSSSPPPPSSSSFSLDNLSPFELFQYYQNNVHDWINNNQNNQNHQNKILLDNAFLSLSKFIPWLLSQSTLPAGLDPLALADNILSIQQNKTYLKFVIPLLELSLKTPVNDYQISTPTTPSDTTSTVTPSSPSTTTITDSTTTSTSPLNNINLQIICQLDEQSYRRICQDLYAMLIWLYSEIDDHVMSKKYLEEYNQPRPLSRQFYDIFHPHRQLPTIRAKSWWSENEFNYQFLSGIQSNYLIIKNEILTLLSSPIWGPYLDIRLSTNSNWDPYTSWDSIPLYDGNKLEFHSQYCQQYLPLTCQLLQQYQHEFLILFNRSNYMNLLGNELIQQDYTEIPTLGIKFYKIWPNSRIKSHMGSPGRIVHSLGIIVPSNPTCTVTVGNLTKDWIEGEFYHFDDSFIHSVDNPNMNESRIVLAFVTLHPDLLKDEFK